jgi:hypothetical protein
VQRHQSDKNQQSKKAAIYGADFSAQFGDFLAVFKETSFVS